MHAMLGSAATSRAACSELGIPRLLRRRMINRALHPQKLGGFDPALWGGKCTRFGILLARILFVVSSC